jgi:hypothetical protein
MPKITFKWNWEPDKPSNLHCGHCGHQMTITPRGDELKAGFFEWYCVRCGTGWWYGTKPKPVEPQPVEPIAEPVPNNPDIWKRLGYPQTRRLFERRRATEWVNLMVGDGVLDHQKNATIATKLKACYRFTFRKNPTKVDNQNSYSGIELNACLERMHAADKQLTNELLMLHLEKNRRDVDVGSLLFTSEDIAREIVKVDGDYLFFDIDGELKHVNRLAAMNVIHADPAKNF